ncbi:MAG: hypothetical protein ACP5VE_01990 [Chthonomonadales bacterium]
MPIEEVQPGQFVLGHDGAPHQVLRVMRRPYRGTMVGLRNALSERILWLTADHFVLAKCRPRSLGGNRDWSDTPRDSLLKRQRLRREMTATERQLWSKLRSRKIGCDLGR